MKIGDFFSRTFSVKSKYALKFFVLTVAVILIPLITLVVFITNKTGITPPLRLFGIGSVLATLLLLVVIYRKFIKLTHPVEQAREMVIGYIKDRKVHPAPAANSDEMGLLLNDLHETLQQIDNMLTEKSDMIDLLSHDLRSPVTRIMGLSNLIKMDADPEIAEYSDYIHNECSNLLTLLENIMLMFKEGVNSFEPQNINLLQLVAESVAFFNIATSEKNLTMKVDIDNKLFINVQESLFTQALRNLLGNAIKFSPEEKSIYITAVQNDNKVIITIKDEGLGMKQSDVVRIFDRFTKAGKKGTHGEKSFGLGLYLSKKIIEKQGGEIVATSKGSNRGAVFTITLNQLITKKRK